jgi:Mg2+/Co2+ transporter CorB
LLEAMHPPYFVPEGASLNIQLVNFQRSKRRIALVVDEYGDILGLVTLEDLLEEIVGEFTTDAGDDGVQDIHEVGNGEYLVDGSATVRDINRAMGWHLPTRQGRTINGMILEHMETIPNAGTCFLLDGYPVEVVQTRGNAVRSVRILPRRPMPDCADGVAGGH